MSMRARKLDDYEKDGPNARMQGAHKDQMANMFDKKHEKQGDAKAELMSTLEANRKTYDRQLYSDWIIKVYDRCRNICLDGSNPAWAQAQGESREQADQMRNCGKSCLRKYDKVYRLYSNLEGTILQSYCEEEGIDQEEFAQQAMAKMESNMTGDLQHAA